MTTKKSWIGAIQHEYDNGDAYGADGATLEGLRTEDQIFVETAPTSANHVMRLTDMFERSLRRITVADIDDPSPELALITYATYGRLVFAMQSTGWVTANEWTLYAWIADTPAEDIPYTISAVDGTGTWIALAGKYVQGPMHVSSLGVDGLFSAVGGSVTSITTAVDTVLRTILTEGTRYAIDTPYAERAHAMVETTDASQTVAGTMTTVSGRSYILEIIILARRTGGANIGGSLGDTNSYKLTGTFKNISGTLTQVGTTTEVFSDEDAGSWSVALGVSSLSIQVLVTGAANTNIRWAVFCSQYRID